jgi:hypothetical protein
MATDRTTAAAVRQGSNVTWHRTGTASSERNFAYAYPGWSHRHTHDFSIKVPAKPMMKIGAGTDSAGQAAVVRET